MAKKTRISKRTSDSIEQMKIEVDLLRDAYFQLEQTRNLAKQYLEVAGVMMLTPFYSN